MFIQDYINVTDFVKIGKNNALAVKVYPVDVPGSTKPKSWGAAGEFHNGGNGNIGLNTTMLMTVAGTLPLWMASVTAIQVSGKTFLSMLPER